MNTVDKYLIAVNVMGCIGYLINKQYFIYAKKEIADKILTVLALMGGSLGILAAILLFDRKASKDNMMLRVSVVCIFAIQIILLLFLKGKHKEELTFAFWEFFGSHKLLLAYLVVINLVTFLAFAVDKANAVRNRTRIRIATLLGLAFIGGSVGGMLGMYLLRHKTKKNYFTVGIPLIMLMQTVVVFFLINCP